MTTQTQFENKINFLHRMKYENNHNLKERKHSQAQKLLI